MNAGTGTREPRAALAAERVSTLERLAGLEREFAGIAESSASASTDDEHDPAGATIAFERQHVPRGPMSRSSPSSRGAEPMATYLPRS